LKYYPFQKAGIQFCVRKFSRGEGGVLIGDQPGLGKSCQAVGVMNCNPEIKRVLVFTKASLKNFWAREMKRWSVRKLEIGMASGQRWPATEIVIANYDIAAKWAKRMRMLDWDLVILDESQACKNPKAQRTKAIMGDKKAGLAPLRARYRLCCSGTPIENRPIELFTTLNFLDPARWRSYWGYAKRYCGMVSNGWGMDVSGASNLNELQIILRETGVLIRRLKAEVLRELPAKTRVVVELEGDEMGAALAQENAVSSRYAAELEQAQAGIELARALESDDAFKAAVKALAAAHNIPFTEMAKVRHQTALAKLPAAIEAIKEDLDEFSVKQVIFAHHSDVIAGLRSAFPGSVAITGETPAEDRQAIVDRFQSEPGCGPFFGSIRACGEGITLTAARLCSFIEIDWSPAKMEQASDRIHRIGQRDNVLIKHLVVRGSIDAWIIQTILAKQEIIEKALDTDPGEWATEPVLVARHEPIGKRKEIAEEALLMTTEQNLAIHAELKRLDEAGSGFSKVDAAIGRALAGLPVLTAKQAVLAKRLCLRQIGEIKL
jgi:SWI/SNF-related matrix-associated actin-dependent regulator 1 of chromatin subfamily A